MPEKTVLEELQRWYRSNCDGDWEHSYGISIRTSDNPGWIVEIDLAGTDLENRVFESLRKSVSDDDYLFCSVETKDDELFFRGSGDATKLEALLLIFLRWAGQANVTS